MRSLVILVALLIMAGLSNAQSNSTEKDLTMYPPAKEGYEQVIIHLPKKKSEDNLKVEITVGKNVEVDKCNSHFLLGSFKDSTVEGWGYNFFEYNSKGDVGGTLMGCPDNNKVIKFVTGGSEFIHYNSKLPIVIYIPKGMEVKFRIWTADKKGWK